MSFKETKTVVVIPNMTLALYTIYADGTVLHQPSYVWLEMFKSPKQVIIKEFSFPNIDVDLITDTACVCVCVCVCVFLLMPFAFSLDFNFTYNKRKRHLECDGMIVFVCLSAL